jgi:hypothetical protein
MTSSLQGLPRWRQHLEENSARRAAASFGFSQIANPPTVAQRLDTHEGRVPDVAGADLRPGPADHAEVAESPGGPEISSVEALWRLETKDGDGRAHVRHSARLFQDTQLLLQVACLSDCLVMFLLD